MQDAVFLSITIDVSEGPVVIVSIEIAEGCLEVMAEIETDEKRGVITAKGLGPIMLLQIARAMLDELDYDECRIEGGVPTPGASPGRRQKPVRFTRKPRPTS